MHMIERVARAIDPDVFRARDVCQEFLLSARQPWEGSYEKKMHDAKIAAALERARAAIEAMREPTEGMLIAGMQAGLKDNAQYLEDISHNSHSWSAVQVALGNSKTTAAIFDGMIAAALQERANEN